MAKSTRAQENKTGTSDSYTDEELLDPTPPVVVTRAVLGVDPKWVGTNSTASSESESNESESAKQPRRKPAQTTDNRSSRTETETDSDAISTDGDTPKTGQRQSGKAGKKANVRSTGSDVDDDDFFD
jgi:hypothetical protein